MGSPLLQNLLPGIPNSVVLNEIVTKLPRKDAGKLALVSCGWLQAIWNRDVYDARVRRNSTECHVGIKVAGDHYNGLVLYSVKDKTLHQLPKVPNSQVEYKFIALDGKLYMLGGYTLLERFWRRDLILSNKVYVLDLAGLNHWEQCASMLQPRRDFRCGIMGGKNYVFGGACASSGPDVLSEVYDPKVDAWFPIMPMLEQDMSTLVTTVGEELLVHHEFNVASSFQVYNTQRDEWRKVTLEHSCGHDMAFLASFMVRGKIYAVFPFCIVVYDTINKWWVYQCPIACDELGPDDCVRITTWSILPVNEELLAHVSWTRTDTGTYGECLLQSLGFQSTGTDIVWSKAPYPFDDSLHYISMCCVQL